MGFEGGVMKNARGVAEARPFLEREREDGREIQTRSSDKYFGRVERGRNSRVGFQKKREI